MSSSYIVRASFHLIKLKSPPSLLPQLRHKDAPPGLLMSVTVTVHHRGMK